MAANPRFGRRHWEAIVPTMNKLSIVTGSIVRASKKGFRSLFVTPSWHGCWGDGERVGLAGRGERSVDGKVRGRVLRSHSLAPAIGRAGARHANSPGGLINKGPSRSGGWGTYVTGPDKGLLGTYSARSGSVVPSWHMPDTRCRSRTGSAGHTS